MVETIDQRLVRVSDKPEEKRAALRQLIRGEAGLTNAIIFCNRKRDVATLARSLQRHGFSAGGLHGDMDQKSRMETLDAFKTDKLKLLVASDVAARGLDIPAVSHVFNFDVPTHAEDYIHRIGRTGRAGRSGISITLATPVRRQISRRHHPADPARNSARWRSTARSPSTPTPTPRSDASRVARRREQRTRRGARARPAPRRAAPRRDRAAALLAAARAGAQQPRRDRRPQRRSAQSARAGAPGTPSRQPQRREPRPAARRSAPTGPFRPSCCAPAPAD